LLVAQEHIPANRFVDIDRAWQSLDISRLEITQITTYQAVNEKITHLLRSRGDQHLLIKRWSNDADSALAALHAGSIAVAETGLERDRLAAVYDAVAKLNTNAPVTLEQDAQSRDISHTKSLLDAALQLARALDARLAFLDRFLAESGAVDTATWHALPAIAEIKVAALLNARFDAIRKTHQQTHQIAEHAAKDALAEKNKARRHATLATLTDLLATAEAALGEGHIVEATTSLEAIEVALKEGSTNTKLQSRIDALRAEITRLKGWQHWGGGRVREDLVGEAEVLAKAITDEKLHIKTHADAIEKLRERWKELDKLGGATSRELWINFDGALKTAYLPVSAQLAKLKAVRQENLAARNQLIAVLDAIPLALETATPSTELPTILSPVAPLDLCVAPHATLRDLARGIEHFQGEWRKLGPVEHTVPRKAQVALLERMRISVARLELPLNEARRIEALKREKLITRAKALSVESQHRDTINKIRELQTEWQQHAKGLPLQRNVENRLWSEFKTATDAIFQARDAANAARDATFQANAIIRDELIARLHVLTADSPPAEIKKVIAEVDTAWRRAGEAPRSLASKLDKRFRTARDAALQFSTGSAKRTWLRTCESVAVKLALSIAAESSSGLTADIVEERWCAAIALPPIWEKPLRTRLDRALAGQPIMATTMDDELLRLEAALEIESPQAFTQARREMKLRAMKNAIEARQKVTVTNADIEQW
ncbi:MAG: DUF349 domain-containing protein, partial [Pseudomonadota bacterium]